MTPDANKVHHAQTIPVETLLTTNHMTQNGRTSEQKTEDNYKIDRDNQYHQHINNQDLMRMQHGQNGESDEAQMNTMPHNLSKIDYQTNSLEIAITMIKQRT